MKKTGFFFFLLIVFAVGAEIAWGDEMWPGECRVKIQTPNPDGFSEWFAWRDLKSCRAGIHVGQVHTTSVDGKETIQWLGAPIIALHFKPFPEGYVREGPD